MPDFLGYWGKSRPAWHLLPYHCLDVAAVGQAYLRAHHRLRRHLARRLGLPEPVLLAWTGFFLALHDLGKFACSFQSQREDIRERLQPETPAECHSGTRHDSLGFLLWDQEFSQHVAEAEWFGPHAQDPDTVEDALDVWMQAVTGHHGRPPQTDGTPLGQAFTPQDIAAARGFVELMRELFLGGVESPVVEWRALAAASRPLSWWLAGIAVLADWIGSNTRWFDYVDDPDYGLRRYWSRAQRQARTALTESGVLPVEVAGARGLTVLFPRVASPTPLQAACAGLALSDGPQLFLLEDVTGAGKTEAALLLAHRLMADGRADGLYFALPTMATAGAMYGRLGECHRRLFGEAAAPSLVLAHGASHLDPRFRASVLASTAVDLDGDDKGDPETAGARCNAWLADSRKRSLLAHVGAGTIDQALLAVLQSRHQSLRLLGLFGKVLIVDEVHANDAYMHQLLQQALTAHAAGGGSAILLSATLPANMRAALVRAFRRGLGCSDPASGATDAAYPLLTRIDAGPAALAIPTETRPQLRRRVEVRWVEDRQAVVEHLLATAAADGCGAWICNTVADARAAWRDLREAMSTRGLDTERLSLFHSRFAIGDRRRIEDAVLEDLGTQGHERRRGRIVVGTQVLQESLDIDFDTMVTDLAPIDLVIQRAGRLHRHVRDAGGARRDDSGADARGAPELWVHGPLPAPDAGPDWYRSVFPAAAHVYPDHAALWRTAHWLRRGGFHMPGDARDMIESVFGDGRIDAPDALQDSAIREEGKQFGHASLATFNAIDFERGYRRGGADWLDDARTPTRLGADEKLLRLARWDGVRWRPLLDVEANAWEWSSVKIAAYHAQARATLPDEDMERAACRAEASLPDRGRWSLLLPLTRVAAGETWVGEAVDQRGNRLRLYYSADMGLMREKDLPEGDDRMSPQ